VPLQFGDDRNQAAPWSDRLAEPLSSTADLRPPPIGWLNSIW